MSATVATVRLRNYVGGSWAEVDGVGTLDDVEPATGEVAALVPLSGAAEVRAAAEAARAAQPGWRAVPPQQRARAVLALREGLIARREELAALVTADMGKTLADADGEVGRGIESVEAAAAIPHLLKGEMLEGVAGGVDVELVRQPVGVVAAITPFNFPAMIPLWFLPFAIACGNTFILKPSEQDPRPGALIAEIVDSVEAIPDGVVNLVHGSRDAVTAILEEPEIDAVSFVGKAETARIIAQGGAASGKRVQALGGAKNSLVVMPDADLERAVPAIMGSAFGAAGQRCLAGSVCVAVGDEERRREVREALVAAASALNVGGGADPATDVCPMVSAESRERVAAAIERGEQRGGRAAARRTRRRWARGDAARADDRGRRSRVRARPRRALRAAADRRRRARPRLRARVPQPLALRQRGRDLHLIRRGRPRLPLRRRGRHARRQHRRPGPGRLVPVLGLEGLDGRRPPRQRQRRGRVLHPQEGRHQPLVTTMSARSEVQASPALRRWTGMAEGGNLRSLARIAIVLLCIGAAVLLVAILRSDRFDNEAYGKALESAVFLSFICLPVAAGANLIARQPGIAPFGYLTILVGPPLSSSAPTLSGYRGSR